MEEVQRLSNDKEIEALPEIVQSVEANQGQLAVDGVSIVIELFSFPNQGPSLPSQKEQSHITK